MLNKKKIKLTLMSAFALLALVSCGTASKTVKNAAPAPENEPQQEEIGITQRENDLDDYVDLRPDREGVEDNTPMDEGALTDHIFEFENMTSTGGSREKDHLCSAVSYVTSTDFSGNIAVECVDVGVAFQMEIESDKAVRVPMIIGINNNDKANTSLDGVFTITNNGKHTADYSAIVPETGHPAVGAPQGYFDMVQVESAISLVKGTNKIKFNLNLNSINLDFVNLKTSANIVDKTVSGWDIPNYEVAVKPTEKQGGLLQITCGKCGHINRTRYLPELTNPIYKVTEEGFNKTYSMTLGGQEFVVATINTDPANEFAEDKGQLVDNFFEFENAEITGVSQDAKDHFCAGNSLVYSHDFSNNFCVENIAENTTFTFNIESSERLKVPYKFNLSAYSLSQSQLSSAFIMKNNGNVDYVDASYVVPWSDDCADVGDISRYFNMVEATGTLNLVKGLNKIEITVIKAGMNIDYFNIQTSAKLTNVTKPFFTDTNKPRFSLVKAPTFTTKGVVAVDCVTGTGEKCHREYNYVPTLANKSYIVEPIDNKTANYYINLFGEKLLVATDVYESTQEQVKDNKFEFENAQIKGVSQNIEDHFCASKSLVLSPDFSNNFCVENTNDNTTFTFNIESDKETFADFDIGMTSNNFIGTPLSGTITMTNNGDASTSDLGNIITGTGFSPDIGDLSIWFNMVTVPGTIKLNKGMNKIDITTKVKGVNLDYFNIKTSANLIDNTKSFWNETNAPKFEVVQAPTAEARGTIKLTCPHSGCANATREYNYIPTLNDTKYIVKADGYYLNLFGKDFKVAAK